MFVVSTVSVTFFKSPIARAAQMLLENLTYKWEHIRCIGCSLYRDAISRVLRLRLYETLDGFCFHSFKDIFKINYKLIVVLGHASANVFAQPLCLSSEIPSSFFLECSNPLFRMR